MHLTISTGIYWGLTTHQALFWAQWTQPWGNRAPRVSLYGGRQTIRRVNLSTCTDDEKEKEAGSGGWRLKGGSESTWGVRALLRGGWAYLGEGGGAQSDLERLLLTEGGVNAGATGRCPRGSGQGGRRAELSKNEGSEGRDRAGDWCYCQ